MAKRKTYSAETKARAVLELLREEKSLTQVAAEYGVYPNQLRRWRQTAIEQLPALFAGDSAAPTDGGSSTGRRQPPAVLTTTICLNNTGLLVSAVGATIELPDRPLSTTLQVVSPMGAGQGIPSRPRDVRARLTRVRTRGNAVAC